MKTIIAAVDFSPNIAQVAGAAIKLGRQLQAQVVLLHVAPPPTSIRDVLPAVDTVAQRTRTLVRAAEENLAELKREFHRRYAGVDSLVCSGAAAETILEQAARLRAEYIVIGSHGHSAAHDLLLGSVASAVVKHAVCPVLVVPPETPAPHQPNPAAHEPHPARS